MNIRAGRLSLPALWLSKKWLAPLFRGVHSSLAPTARPGSYARKPLLRKAFCGFDAHVAKSDQSLRGLRPPNPRGGFRQAEGAGPFRAPPPFGLAGPGAKGPRAAKRRRPPLGRWASRRQAPSPAAPATRAAPDGRPAARSAGFLPACSGQNACPALQRRYSVDFCLWPSYN